MGYKLKPGPGARLSIPLRIPFFLCARRAVGGDTGKGYFGHLLRAFLDSPPDTSSSCVGTVFESDT